MKKLVNIEVLEDMKKYIQGFDESEYEACNGDTPDTSIIEYVKNYYNKHLPVDLTAWARVNKPSDELSFSNSFKNHIIFVRDNLCQILIPNYEEWKNNQPMVISTYRSKMIRLPIIQINLKKYGVEIILRYNFYDWKVSVNSKTPLYFNCQDVFDPNNEILTINCKGFPKDKIYSSYSKNKSKFTAEIFSHYKLLDFINRINKCLKQKNLN